MRPRSQRRRTGVNVVDESDRSVRSTAAAIRLGGREDVDHHVGRLLREDRNGRQYVYSRRRGFISRDVIFIGQ